MREALIVSTARTPIGKAYRGAYNNTTAPTLAGIAVKEAVKRAGVDPNQVDDVIMGAALQQGTTGGNIGRLAALAGGLPATVSGMSIDRQCSSGMMAIATAADLWILSASPGRHRCSRCLSQRGPSSPLDEPSDGSWFCLALGIQFSCFYTGALTTSFACE